MRPIENRTRRFGLAIRPFLRRLTTQLGRKRRLDRDLDEEMRFHLEMEMAHQEQRGLDPHAARTEALRRFGGVEQTKQRCRDEVGLPWLEHFARDLRLGLRSLSRAPGFTLVVVATLALGIGANTALFSVVHGVLLRPLPYGDSDRLVHLRQQAPGVGLDRILFSVPEIEDVRSSMTTLDDVVEYHSMSFTLLDGDEPVQVETGVVSAGFFDTLGIEPLLGRTFRPQDDRHGAPPVLVLGHGFWQRRFGGDPAIVGRAMRMNDRIHTVIGVLPPVPLYPGERDVYMPTSACPIRSDPQFETDRERRMMQVFAHRRPGADLASVNAELAALTGRLAEEYPANYPAGSGYTATAAPLRDEIVGGARSTLWVLFATVASVLLIACFNVANLMLARQIRRERELVVRSALGAGRGRLVRQLLTESLLLATAGGALGLALAYAALPALLGLTGPYLPRASEVVIDTPVLLFTVTVSLVTGLFFGALPAFAGGRDLAPALRNESGHLTESAAGRRTRHALIVSQLAVSFVLLVAAGLMVRSLVKLHHVDSGFEPRHVLAMTVSPNWTRYPGDRPELRRMLYERLLERVSSHPSVQSAAVAHSYPLESMSPQIRLAVEGDARPIDQLRPPTDYNVVSTGYFRTLGIPLVEGRVFDRRDREGAPPVAVVSRTFARLFWGESDPIGARLVEAGGPEETDETEEKTAYTVVGVVGDTRKGLAIEPAAEIYFPFQQRPTGVWRLVVRTRNDPRSLIDDLRKRIWDVEPEQPVTQERTLADLRSAQLAEPARIALLLGLFALLALAITATGIAGVIAFSVGQRRHEIGIRMALGAARTRVLSMVLGQGLRLAVAGLVLGALGASIAGAPLAHLLYEVTPHDLLTFVAVGCSLLAVAVLACWLPARRATRIHPMTALRSD